LKILARVVLFSVMLLTGAVGLAQVPVPRPAPVPMPSAARPAAPPAESAPTAENVSPIVHAEPSSTPPAAPEAVGPATPTDNGWSYQGATGPEHWAELSSDYLLCGSGRSQSPIDIRRAYTGRMVPSRYRPGSMHYQPLERLRFVYYPGPLHILRTEHNLQVNDESGSYFRVGRHKFDLAQILFRVPGEHRVGGHAYPMELQLVHRHDDALGVVSVLITEGGHNRALEAILNAAPKKVGEEMSYRILKLSAADLLPHDKSYYHYMGSLTTPPCSEGVYWYVMKQPIGASPKQIRRVRAMLGNNARPPQPLNDRDVFQTGVLRGD
jgi:carbonic anhydrase